MVIRPKRRGSIHSGSPKSQGPLVPTFFAQPFSERVQMELRIATTKAGMGFSQGLLAALVADAAPKERRGTAFGLFSFVSGMMLIAASVVAGELWDRVGAPTTFYAGASLADWV